MALLGSLVKTGISITQKLQFEHKAPLQLQQLELEKLLEKAKNTAFGKYYGFDSLLESADPISEFTNRVPIHNYPKMDQEWWNQQQQHPDITWPGKPDFFALSSGTTGKSSKRIPITDAFLQSIKDVGASMVSSLPNFDFPEELYESEILMLSSSSNLNEHDGHLEGEISGINVSNFPGWYDLFYRPGKEIAAIDDWDERIRQIVQAAPNWNIGAVAGIPSWVLIMLKEIIKAHGLENIHELWPNFTVYASGGVAFDTYRKDFEKLSGKSVTIIDTYLASEGFFSYTARPGTLSMELALSHGYFYEFIPFDERGVDSQGNLLAHPESHHIEEVQKDQEYALVVSTCAGAWRYVIGDTIKFVSLDPHEIKLTGRIKFFLNVVGSQLSEEKMDAAIVDTAAHLNTSVNEYAVATLQDKKDHYYHQWVIVTDDSLDEETFKEKLDRMLKDANKNYAVARSKALKYIQVKGINKKVYHAYLEEKKQKGGQVKTPKVMDEEKMRDFLEFIHSQ